MTAEGGKVRLWEGEEGGGEEGKKKKEYTPCWEIPLGGARLVSQNAG